MKTPGEVYSLKVLRKTDIGYMLTDGEENPVTKRPNEYFLHFRQATKELDIEEYVLAFLFYDSEKRITATMEKPTVTLSKPGWGVVREVNQSLGIFVNIGITKDILISKDMLPYSYNEWPKVDEKLYIHLKAKANQLVGKIAGKALVTEHGVELSENDTVVAHVSRIMPEGISLYTDDLNVIFVHKTQMRNSVHLGEQLEVKITRVNPNYEYNGSLIQRKEEQFLTDSEYIVNYLKSNKGRMRFGNDSSPEDILRQFNMSKKAFKRALGHLYKEHIIDFEDGFTILK